MAFFSCGYQLSLVTAHFPALVAEMCGAIDPSETLASLGLSTTSALSALAISMIGLANIVGTRQPGIWAIAIPRSTYWQQYIPDEQSSRPFSC